ncbi:MAG TPA: hypothetical protein PKH78_15395 [Candidatus Obscuribacter sp.]|nr:hypothetical protein [Candidatus Melainabacteria bacterium]MBK8220003.1 hypothetical protein [Candidatus Obscuribacter sp.]MBK9281219.1 hypothetical protein [Candidatus Obscuribacter sp.]MDX1989636.1 hypothetical protein [Candidatus Obscuribacter sp.]HND08748.1 hypothetical protein [Candidatus Obscuribacter sp.]
MAQDSSKSQRQPITLSDLEQFKPQDEQDSRERAIFYATATAVLAGNILTSYINYCKSAVVFSATGQFKPVETEPITEEQFKRMAKEVQTISLWLTICENCGDEIPDWFKEFSYNSLRASDELIDEPITRDIFQTYPLDLGLVPTVQTLSMNVCHKLALGSTRVDAALALGDIILEADVQRIELLKFSLCQSMLVLDAWVAEVKPGAFQLQY